jgi:prepilin-type N-terminal cleavage/methylation domain-containing protein
MRFKRGFTLIELLVVTALASVLFLLSAVAFSSLLSSQSKTEIIAEVRQNADAILSQFERDVREATGMTVAGTTVTLTGGPTTVVWNCNNGGNFTRNGEAINNTHNIHGVRVSSCTLDNTTGSPATVRLVFVLEQAANAPNRDEYKISETFRTTLTTREF